MPTTDVSLDRTLVDRAGWSLVWVAMLGAALWSWEFWSTWPVTSVIGPLLSLVALVGVAVLWTRPDPGSSLLCHVTFALALVTAFFSQGVQIASRAWYTTDSAAFNQVATAQLLRGTNPYTSSMVPEVHRYVKDLGSLWTYTLDGGHVSSISYPAGSFLLQVPLQALGVHHLTTDWLDLLAGCAAAILLYLMLPHAIRWLAPILVLSGSFLGVFANGGTDALFLPFLLVAVWRWDRFSDPTTGWMRWLSPVALGMACSVKQSAWFCVPFLVVGVALEARRHQRGSVASSARYLTAAAGTFLAINLPFLVWSPRAWLSGITLPLSHPLVPDGQGLITLGLHGATRSIHLGPLEVAGSLTLVLLLLGFILFYAKLKRIWLFLLPLALFVPSRSLYEYLVDFIPVAIVAAVTVADSDLVVLPSLSRAWRRTVVAVPLGALAVCVVLGVTSPVLGVRVLAVTTSADQRLYRSMTLELHNTTVVAVHPSVTVLENKTHSTGFWHTSSGAPIEIAPGATVRVRLFPPPFTWTSLRDQSWIVAAYVPDPASVSTSPAMRWNLGQR